MWVSLGFFFFATIFLYACKCFESDGFFFRSLTGCFFFRFFSGSGCVFLGDRVAYEFREVSVIDDLRCVFINCVR